METIRVRDFVQPDSPDAAGEINRLLATGRWKVRSLDWDDEIPVAKLVRNKR